MHSHDPLKLKQLIDIVEAGNKEGDARSNISMGIVPGPGGQVRASSSSSAPQATD